MAGRHSFDNENVWHDGEDVVVRGKWCEPVDGEIVNPDDEDGKVDGEDPQHEDEETVDVVVEVVVVARSLSECVSFSFVCCEVSSQNSLFLVPIAMRGQRLQVVQGRGPGRRIGRV